ncbi:HAD-superfamily hydrolase, subfamily IB, PSPase-like [Parasponia andersonii]|uniref:HAD-superfamily hydrolase, subfamily IB, PSPase-like n=1 Tax=Parasponia andersonii TaxID=3476 RepID=A0A2P5DTU3_PARAD|nr:HAD-superfamily hydrolase, subfamily IB, PSPase-like [Parasponia andersonii]
MRASLSAQGKKRFIYVGDGRPDFCAGLKLEGDDYLLAQEGFPNLGFNQHEPEPCQAKDSSMAQLGGASDSLAQHSKHTLPCRKINCS